MKRLILLFCLFSTLETLAQSTATITLTAPAKNPALVTLVQEDVRFDPNLGAGLADVRLDPVGRVNFAENLPEKVTIQLTKPNILRLQYNGNGIARTWMLFIQPGDDMTASFGDKAEVSFSGKNAGYQTFLKNYFLENQYQYLPVFGYKPSQIENQSVVQQSDSLQQARLAAYEKFKSDNPANPAFEAYVLATTATEPMLIRRLIQEKIMRRNRVMKLDAAQRKELEDFTLSEFKLFPDDALLSQAYRDELRNWILIPATRRFPLDQQSRYEISPDALKEVYASSKEKLASYPRQKEYLLTYWLNYAITAIPTIETGKTLLADYKATFPQSPYTEYLTKLLATKEALQPGATLADVKLLSADSTVVSVSSLKGKPFCMVFSFSIGQHEPGLKTLEDKYAGKVSFVYVSVAPGTPLSTWKTYAKDRPNGRHLWASDETIETLKEKYAIDIRYPFLVADASGKIVERYIPQEFPDNKSLDAALTKASK